MIGAIIGDIVGSKYEFGNIKTKDFDLFSDGCRFTDDSIMTIAIAKALQDCEGDYGNLSSFAVKEMRDLGNRYINCGFGGGFLKWLKSENPKAYNSYGNGAGMRISAVGFIARSIDEAKSLSYKVTSITHNHKEGIKGAEAVAVAIHLAKQGKNKNYIKKYINENYYNLNFTLNEIRNHYSFDVTCQGSIPQAFVSFFESDSFEDALKNAVSIGGDSDTIACIAGGLAEAYYGVDKTYISKLNIYFDSYIINTLKNLQEHFNGELDNIIY